MQRARAVGDWNQAMKVISRISKSLESKNGENIVLKFVSSEIKDTKRYVYQLVGIESNQIYKTISVIITNNKKIRVVW